MARTARIHVEGSTVLLTGATGGIGNAIARAVSVRGGRLLLSGRRTEVLEQLATEVGGRTIGADLSDRADVERLGQEAVAAGTDILIANAALPASGAFDELTQEQIDRMLRVNLRAPIALSRALVPSLMARGAGHLVFISSLSGKTASPASSMYAATKFGLRGFALGLREDMRSHGVGVSGIFPGFIREAGMFADADVKLPPGVGTRSPAEVADAVVRAIEEDRAEIDVAPLGLRLGAMFGGLAPEIAATVSRRLGASEIATNLADGQRDKR